MASIKLTGDTSGEITISAPAVAGTNTLTLPASTGTVVTSNSPASDLPSTISGPAFSAYLGSVQSVSASTFTKVSLNVESFDTDSNYDNSTNYRFTPTVAGYYQINACVLVQQSSGTGTIALCQVRKNTTTVIQQEITCTYTSGLSCCASGLVYLNGSTDYVELYGYTNAASSPGFGAGLSTTYMNGCLVRAA